MSEGCCGGESCESKASSCEESSCGGCSCGRSGCSGEPMDCATGMWTGSFFEAMKQNQVDILKAKMQKAWGPKMEKAAEAVIEAMGVQWQSMLAQSKAKADLQQRLASLWQEK